MKKLAILLAVSTLALGACAPPWTWKVGDGGSSGGGGGGGGTASKESVTAAIAEAEAAQKKAGTQAEWVNVSKMIIDAKAALEKGELDNAMKQAKQAKEQLDLGTAQAAGQKGAKPWLF